MLRTCSPALLSAIAVFGLSALTALNGCVIYTSSGRPSQGTASTTPAAAAPTPTTPTAPAGRRTGTITSRTGGAPAPAPAVTTGPRASTIPRGTPRITSPTVFGNGNGGTFQGMAYVIPDNTTALPNLDQLVPFAALFIDSFNIPVQPYTAGFPGALRQNEWFAIRYEGAFVVPTGGPALFDLTSDDGAILYVDGQLVINNDGVHAATRKTGTKDLRPGTHTLRLDYMQAAGPVSLRLLMTANGGVQTIVMGVPR